MGFGGGVEGADTFPFPFSVAPVAASLLGAGPVIDPFAILVADSCWPFECATRRELQGDGHGDVKADTADADVRSGRRDRHGDPSKH